MARGSKRAPWGAPRRRRRGRRGRTRTSMLAISRASRSTLGSWCWEKKRFLRVRKGQPKERRVDRHPRPSGAGARAGEGGGTHAWSRMADASRSSPSRPSCAARRASSASPVCKTARGRGCANGCERRCARRTHERGRRGRFGRWARLIKVTRGTPDSRASGRGRARVIQTEARTTTCNGSQWTWCCSERTRRSSSKSIAPAGGDVCGAVERARGAGAVEGGGRSARLLGQDEVNKRGGEEGESERERGGWWKEREIQGSSSCLVSFSLATLSASRSSSPRVPTGCTER